MKRTLIATVLTTLGLGLTLNAQPGPRWADGDNSAEEIRGPGRQGPPPWAMRGGPAGSGPRWAQPDTEQQPDQAESPPGRLGIPRRGAPGGPNGMGPRWARPDVGQTADRPDVAPAPDRQGPPPWAGRGPQNRANRQATPPGLNRGQRDQGPRAFAGPGAERGQMMRQMLRNRLQNAPRSGVNRQGPPPWIDRGGRLGAGRQGALPGMNRGQGGRGPRAFAGPGTAGGQMFRQMLRNRLQNAPQRGRLMQQGICPFCGSECGRGALMQRGLGATRRGAWAQPDLQTAPRGPRGPMAPGTDRGAGFRRGDQEGPANPEVNTPRPRGQEQPDRPTRELRGERAPRGEAGERPARPPRPETDTAE